MPRRIYASENCFLETVVSTLFFLKIFVNNLQLSELGRPFTGGSWCGAATGPQLYYSETSTVTASVKVWILFCNLKKIKLSKNLFSHLQVFHAPMQAATPFEFKIRYKFISQSDAVVRYYVVCGQKFFLSLFSLLIKQSIS